MVAISIILCPIFYLPMYGYQSNGLFRFVDWNLALPAIFTVYCILGILKAFLSMGVSY